MLNSFPISGHTSFFIELKVRKVCITQGLTPRLLTATVGDETLQYINFAVKCVADFNLFAHRKFNLSSDIRGTCFDTFLSFPQF